LAGEIPVTIAVLDATGRTGRLVVAELVRGTAIGRADLAAFVVDCVQRRAHIGEAPLVAAA
jgi:hypothetical protein